MLFALISPHPTTPHHLLRSDSAPGSIEFTKKMISDLLKNQIDMSLLIVTKQLKDNYTNPQPHATLAERMKKRDPGSLLSSFLFLPRAHIAATAPNVGDRVPYVIIRGDRCTYRHNATYVHPRSRGSHEDVPKS